MASPIRLDALLPGEAIGKALHRRRWRIPSGVLVSDDLLALTVIQLLRHLKGLAGGGPTIKNEKAAAGTQPVSG
jgi:hypothetical protein